MPGSISSSSLFSSAFDPSSDWLEATAMFTPNQFSIGREKSYTTLVGYVENFDKLKNCLLYFLGTSYVENGPLLQLKRKLPARHPIWPMMYCKELLDLKGITFAGKETDVELSDLDFAKYRRLKLEFAFTQFPYIIDTDENVHDLIGGEFYRYTTITSKPYVENIVVELGQMRFEANGKKWDDQPMIGRPIVRAEKTAYTVTVHQVPLELIAYQAAGVPSGTYPRFDESIGKLNETALFGKPRGTMMLDDAEVDVYTDPLESDLTGYISRRGNIKFTFKHFDPPRGLSTETRRGWNLQFAYDQKAYWAVNEDTGEPLFRYAEMNNLLKHWSL